MAANPSRSERIAAILDALDGASREEASKILRKIMEEFNG